MGKPLRKPGDVVTAVNGYSYTYVKDELNPEGRPVRKLTHHVIAREKYGRWPAEDERVVFDDGDRTNLDPDNIKYTKKSPKVVGLKRKYHALIERIREAEAQLDDVRKQLKELGVDVDTL